MAGHRLLVVEDHAGTRNALHGIFTRMGWHVHAASTVAEGIKALASQAEFCLLICDLDLPDGDGQAVLSRLRVQMHRTRVVVASGMLTLARLSSLEGLKPDALLSKPISIADVWEEMCPVCDEGECSLPRRAGNLP